MKALWARPPLLVQIATAMVVGLGAFIVVLDLLGATIPLGALQLVANLLGPAVFLAVFPGVRSSMNRRLGGPAQAKLYRAALQSGTVPAEADRDAWRSFVEEIGSRTPAERNRRVWTWLWLPIILAVGVFAAGYSATDEPTGNSFVLSSGIFIAAMAFTVLFWTTVTKVSAEGQRRVELLGAALEQPAAS